MNWISQSCWVHHSIHELCPILALNVHHHQKDPMNVLFLNLGLVIQTHPCLLCSKASNIIDFSFLHWEVLFILIWTIRKCNNCDAPNIAKDILHNHFEHQHWCWKMSIKRPHHKLPPSFCINDELISFRNFISLPIAVFLKKTWFYYWLVDPKFQTLSQYGKDWTFQMKPHMH